MTHLYFDNCTAESRLFRIVNIGSPFPERILKAMMKDNLGIDHNVPMPPPIVMPLLMNTAHSYQVRAG
jgi:hypothetical protein